MQHDLILDIDFDYCIRPTLSRGYDDRARLPTELRIWLRVDELVAWLKQNNLFRPDGFAGAVESHEQVLPIWHALMAAGKLHTPFDLIHLDAHPDMMNIDEDIAQSLDRDGVAGTDMFQHAKPGDFLQYAARLGWINRLWMVFPDDEGDRIASLAGAGVSHASAIVNKPVEAISESPTGGADLRVRIGGRRLQVSLHTRFTLPTMPQQPVATVLAHSPQFVPPSADDEYRWLAQQLGGVQ